MKWEKNISITSLNRFNYVLVLNQLEELLSNIKTEVTTLTLTLVHLTPVSGRLAKKKPWYNPSRTPENQPASRDAPSRQGNHLQTEMSPVNAAAKTTGQPAPLLPKKSASPSLTIQYRIFYEARLLKWDCWRRQKLLQVKIALWLLQQRRKPNVIIIEVDIDVDVILIQ